MLHKIMLTQAEYNAVCSALSAEIRKCFEAPKDEAFMTEEYRRDLLEARESMKSGEWIAEDEDGVLMPF